MFEFWRESFLAGPEVELMFECLAESGLELGFEHALDCWFVFIFELLFDPYKIELERMLGMDALGACTCEFCFWLGFLSYFLHSVFLAKILC